MAGMDLGQTEDDMHQVASNIQVFEGMPKSYTELVDGWLHVVLQVIHSLTPFSFSYPFFFAGKGSATSEAFPAWLESL